jgi:Taurine catabolism dioxygenase TauD, TfdA family
MSPLTVWGEPYSDIVAVQKAAQRVPLAEFGPEISAVALGLDTVESQLEYFQQNQRQILTQMQDHACLVFRDFELMKTPAGFTEFYSALGLQSCLDPLHSVSARPTVNGDKNSPVYEAVNKESRKNFFIGMHNEFVGTRAPRAAAFCCFKAAETGGEFLIADGRRIFRDLPSDLLATLYQRQIRYSVMELPFFAWIDSLPELVQSPVASVVQGMVSTAINMKVDFSVEMQWGISDYDGQRMLQARAPRQPPVVPHPVTQDPTWFCNVHSHSSVLRQARENVYVHNSIQQVWQGVARRVS